MRQQRPWATRVETRGSSEARDEPASTLGLMSAPTLLRGPRPQGRGLKLLCALCAVGGVGWVSATLTSPAPSQRFTSKSPSTSKPPSNNQSSAPGALPPELSEPNEPREAPQLTPDLEPEGVAELKGAPGFSWRVRAPRVPEAGLTSCLRGGEAEWRAERVRGEEGEPQEAQTQGAAELEGVSGVRWTPREPSRAPLGAISVSYEGAHLWVRSVLSPQALPTLAPLMSPEPSDTLYAPPPLLREALSLHLGLTACLRGEASELHDPQRALVWGSSRWPLSGSEATLSGWFEVLSEGSSHQTRGLERLGLRELALTSEHPRARALLRALTLSLLTEGARALKAHWGAWRLREAEGAALLIWSPPKGAEGVDERAVSVWLAQGGEPLLLKALKGAQQGAREARKSRKSRKKSRKSRKSRKRRTLTPQTPKVKLRYE